MVQFLALLATGVFAGAFAGLFGIGGGIVLVPILIMLLGFHPTTANGTSLVALLLPVGAFGVLEYYRAGKITFENIRYGLFIALGMFIGTYLGAKAAVELPESILRRMFAILLALISARMWFH
jgi:uncharacterized protein